MQIVLALFTITGLVAASRLPAFQDAEGFLTPNYCLLIALASAILLIAFSWRTALRQSALWFALLVTAQGLSLQLINAGTGVHYQHYRVTQDISTTYDALLLALLGLLSVVVFVGFRNRIVPVFAWTRAQLGAMRSIVLLGAVILLGAFPSREPQIFILELLFSAYVVIIQLGCLVLGLMSVPSSTMTEWNSRVTGFLNGSGKQIASIDRLAIVCAAWTIGIAILLAIFSYEQHPHIQDEFAYIYHANYFSEGHLYTSAPPVPEAVKAYLMDCNDERCISPVPPGWPAILAIGALANSPWLVNPVLAGINVVLLFMLLHLLYDRLTARLGVLLLSASAWYLLMSMSFMTHIFSLTCALLATLSVAQMYRHRNACWGFPGGLAIGMLSLTRPLEGLMVACTLGLAALFIRGQRIRLAPVATLTLTSVLVGAAVLPYNQALTGDPFQFPIMVYTDKVLGPGVNTLGFGPGKGVNWGGLDPFPGHGLPDVLVNALLNLDAMNIEMFGWGIGSLLPILLLLMSRTSGRLTYIDRWMLFFLAVIFGFQSLYWFSGGPDFGARYYFLAVVPLVALTVSATRELGQTLGAAPPSSSLGQTIILTGLLVLCVSSLINFVPWRAIDKYHHYRGMRPDIRNMLATTDFGPALLLISGKANPDLSSALVYTAIDPYGEKPVIAWDKSLAVRQRLLEAYPDRQVWLIDGPSRTGTGYHVTAGPLSSSELMEKPPFESPRVELTPQI